MSQNDVITTIGPVLKGIQDAILEKLPNVKTVYDEKLSYETAIDKLRADNSLYDNIEEALPLWAYKRSVLRHTDHAPGRKMGRACVVDKDPESDTYSNVYQAVYGVMDVDFMYFTQTMLDEEKFEIYYLADRGIASKKNIEVEVPDIGIITYHVDWLPLEDKEIEYEGNFFKAVKGQAKIKGTYLVFEATAALIEEVNLSIRSYTNVVFKDIKTVP